MNDLFNFGTFFKFLGRNKLYTLIDVFGLSVSLMFVILIAVYTKQELSTDRFHSKADRIYALGNNENFGTAFRLAYRIQERYPEIEKVCPIAPWNSDMTVTVKETKLNTKFLFADSTFFDFFDFKLPEGNREQVLAARNNAVISKTFARKAFGNEDPLGKSITLSDSVTVIVNGVMDDIKNSTIPYCDIMVRIDNVKYFNSSMDSETFNNAGSALIFLMERENANIQSKAEDMTAFFKEVFWIYTNGIHDKVLFVPLKKIYFSDIKSNSMLNQGDWRLVMILMSVGIAILIFAIINYINLTVAQSGFRAKEMATRRLLGSSRKDLFVRLILESTLLCLISFFLALLLAALCAPYADQLLNTKINIASALSGWGILASLCLILILGTVSGWLPATFISSVNPLDITKGSFGRKNKMVFSRFFIVFQNVITIMMLVASITMAAQTWHLIHAPLGYKTANIINVPTDNFKDKGEISVFTNEVKQLASVKRMGFAEGNPLNSWNNNTVQYNGKSIAFQFLGGDTTVFEILGLQMLRDNHLGTASADKSYPDHFYFSRQAMKEAELKETDTEIRLSENWTLQVDGIIGDIQLFNVTHGLEPVLYFFSSFDNQSWWSYPWNIFIETQGDPNLAFQQVKQVYEQVMRLDFNGKFMDDLLKESFTIQQRTSKIVILFTAIAILISSLGILAMSTYFIRQRTKEIAVRKVHGADNFRMLSQLVLTFLGYVGIAFVIAVPLIGYIMERWLSDYSYRIGLSPWIFIAAGGFCLLVSFISVYGQSRRAAHANPVDSLKIE